MTSLRGKLTRKVHPEANTHTNLSATILCALLFAVLIMNQSFSSALALQTIGVRIKRILYNNTPI
jgi:hypothetical protein